MTIFRYAITRRTFLKLGVQLPVMMAGFNRNKAFAFAEQQNIVEQAGYGVGSYGSGEYPGYATYLPLVSKENK
jgi:hypothetical protein